MSVLHKMTLTKTQHYKCKLAVIKLNNDKMICWDSYTVRGGRSGALKYNLKYILKLAVI